MAVSSRDTSLAPHSLTETTLRLGVRRPPSAQRQIYPAGFGDGPLFVCLVVSLRLLALHIRSPNRGRAICRRDTFHIQLTLQRPSSADSDRQPSRDGSAGSFIKLRDKASSWRDPSRRIRQID